MFTKKQADEMVNDIAVKGARQAGYIEGLKHGREEADVRVAALTRQDSEERLRAEILNMVTRESIMRLDGDYMDHARTMLAFVEGTDEKDPVVSVQDLWDSLTPEQQADAREKAVFVEVPPTENVTEVSGNDAAPQRINPDKVYFEWTREDMAQMQRKAWVILYDRAPSSPSDNPALIGGPVEMLDLTQKRLQEVRGLLRHKDSVVTSRNEEIDRLEREVTDQTDLVKAALEENRHIKMEVNERDAHIARLREDMGQQEIENQRITQIGYERGNEISQLRQQVERLEREAENYKDAIMKATRTPVSPCDNFEFHESHTWPHPDAEAYCPGVASKPETTETTETTETVTRTGYCGMHGEHQPHHWHAGENKGQDRVVSCFECSGDPKDAV